MSNKVTNRPEIFARYIVSRLYDLGYTQNMLPSLQKIDDVTIPISIRSAFAPYLTELTLSRLLTEIFSIADNDDRVIALANLTFNSAYLPLSILESLLRQSLRVLSNQTRNDFLIVFRVLIPVIVALGGGEAIAKTCQAVDDVNRWWP